MNPHPAPRLTVLKLRAGRCAQAARTMPTVVPPRQAEPAAPPAPAAPTAPTARAAPAPAVPAEAALRELVQATLRDLRPGEASPPAVVLASRLAEDLGFDSLARVELLQRAEQRFGVELPADTLNRAESVADLLACLQRARPAGSMRAAQAAQAALAAQAAPERAPSPGEPAGPEAPRGFDAAAAAAADGATLTEVLLRHVEHHGQRMHITVLGDDGGEVAISYAELHRRGLAVAAGLREAGVREGETVALMLPTSPEYFFGFIGALLAGAVPVPIYPPARPSQLEDHVRRHAGILANAGAAALLTVREAMPVARLLRSQAPTLRRVLTPEQLLHGGADLVPWAARPDDIAFLQYTSGSTGQPKGVVLTHRQLLLNVRAMLAAARVTSEDRFVSWLPLYHDMGLIGAWLAGLVVGFQLVVMSPLAFLARPRRWLEALTDWRATVSAAPNFAYELCLKRIGDDELEGLDLSRWRLAFNGAEAVSAATVQRFSERFARCGLRPEAMVPVYGLAECGLGLLFPPLPRRVVIDRVQREALMREQRALPAEGQAAAHALTFVGCGGPLPGYDVRIVDRQGREVGERIEGRLEFRGPSATAGYYRNPEATARLRAAPAGGWLDTGDRAYRAGADLFITGRVKDIVIRGGRNLYPEEIEQAVGAVPGVRKGCVAVFGAPDPATGTERLVVLAEVAGRAPDRSSRSAGEAAAGRLALREAVVRAVIDVIGEPPDEVVLAPPHAVLKTSSGKVRRSACRERWLSGRAAVPERSARMQAVRMALLAAAAWLRRAGGTLRAWLGGLRIVLAFFVLSLPTWLRMLTLRRPEQAWSFGGRAARAMLRLSGVPLQVQHLERLPRGPCVLVCNHASYTDGAILMAALPQPFVFVAKGELQRQLVAGTTLRRLGTLFVERFDVARSVEDATRVAEHVRQGHSLALFPEGTFKDAPGLLPFHLGAFVAAARAGVPVVPVTISGSRTFFGGGRWWPRRTVLAVDVGEPIEAPRAAVDAFAAAVAMRDAARRSMEVAALADAGTADASA